MKIDFENDLNITKNNILKSRIAYFLTIALILISNLIFILVSNYNNKVILTIISIIIDIFLIFLLYIEVFVYLLRFKNVYKYLLNIKEFNAEVKTGKLLNISEKFLLRKNIYVKEVTFNINKNKEIYYLLSDLYIFDNLEINKEYSFVTKDKIVVEINNEY